MEQPESKEERVSGVKLIRTTWDRLYEIKEAARKRGERITRPEPVGAFRS